MKSIDVTDAERRYLSRIAIVKPSCHYNNITARYYYVSASTMWRDYLRRLEYNRISTSLNLTQRSTAALCGRQTATWLSCNGYNCVQQRPNN